MNADLLFLVALILSGIAIGLGVYAVRTQRAYAALYDKFIRISDVEAKYRRLYDEFMRLSDVDMKNRQLGEELKQLNDVDAKYRQLMEEVNRLRGVEVKYRHISEEFNRLSEVEVQFRQLYEKYKDVIDADAMFREIEDKIVEVSQRYSLMKATYDSLSVDVSLLEESLEDMSFGFYKPHYEYNTSEEYKAQLDFVRAEQKRLIRANEAAVASGVLLVSDSKSEGRKMIGRLSKLMLRAFNGEADAAVAKVRWNNINQMTQRLEKAAIAINEMGEQMRVEISRSYIDLKLAEIRLAHEYENRRHEEKEEQRLIRDQMREEAAALKDLEEARQKAEKEERDFQVALELARRDLVGLGGEDLDRMKERIVVLERQLESAHNTKVRAISRAQQTRSGHVYVISNVGSFGDTVFKIGMTRRLEPLERVNELGDASVPFRFDVHAIIYSDDAPALENQLHKHFEGRRINLVSNRREFFQVSVEEIEKRVKALGADIEFTKIAEAREYRESLAIRKERKEPRMQEEGLEEKAPKFPATI